MKNSKVFVLSRVVPRPQHYAFISSLIGLEDYLSGIVLVGQLYDNYLGDLLIRRLPFVFQKYVKLDRLDVGFVTKRMLEEGSRLISFCEYVLFLDDDAVLFREDLENMLSMASDNLGVVAVQSNDLEERRIQYSFDFFCSLVPGGDFLVLSHDEELLNLIGKLKKGIAYFILDWYFRKKRKLYFNVYDKGVLHLWKVDKYKSWADWSPEYWDKLYEGIHQCKDLSEIEEFLKKEKLI